MSPILALSMLYSNMCNLKCIFKLTFMHEKAARMTTQCRLRRIFTFVTFFNHFRILHIARELRFIGKCDSFGDINNLCTYLAMHRPSIARTGPIWPIGRFASILVRNRTIQNIVAFVVAQFLHNHRCPQLFRMPFYLMRSMMTRTMYRADQLSHPPTLFHYGSFRPIMLDYSIDIFQHCPMAF